MPKTTRVTRVLIRLNTDGSVSEALEERVEEIFEGGELLASREVPPTPLSAEALARALPSHGAALAAAEAARREAAAAEAERDLSEKRAAELSEDVARLAGELETALDNLSRAKAAIGSALASMAEPASE